MDVKYPKSTGYIDFGYDAHIVVNRGYKEATTPVSSKLSDLFKLKSVVNDVDKRRKQSFVFNFDDGVTFEWMMKKNGFDAVSHAKETVFEASSSEGTVRLALSASADGIAPIQFYASSSAEITLNDIGSSTLLTSSVATSAWNHYALSIFREGSDIKTSLYINGRLDNTKSHTNINNFDTDTTLFIASGSYGLLSASVDDFRYWNKKQTSQKIFRTRNVSLDGGANSDDYRTELGLLLKFNEGLTQTASVDRVALDYSGRIANGYIENYISSIRQTGSAYTNETPDPIIRPTNPRVTSLLAEMQVSGSEYDVKNNMSLYDLTPQWMREEDEESGEEYKKLTQIMASYLDTLYAQIERLPELKDKGYTQPTDKARPFANRLLTDKGFDVTDVLTNRSILEYFESRDLDANFYEKDIAEIRNLIYLNIYNNLEHIYKSKGTEKSYRNLLRCFGIDDEIVKLNLYTDNATQYLVDKTKHTSQKTKHVDFDKTTHFGATVYVQDVVSGSKAAKLEKNSAITAEVEVLVPKKPDVSDSFYYFTSFQSSSVFGVDAVATSGLTYDPSTALNNFQVYLVRDGVESDRAQWVLEQKNISGGSTSVVLTSSFYNEIYNNTRWNIAVRIHPQSYPFAGSYLSSSLESYTLSFYGVSHNSDEVLHEFDLTTTISNTDGSTLLAADKKVYVGARRTNWSGSIETRSDVKIAACSLYYDKLDNKSIKQHNLDPSNYGHNKVFGNPTLFATDQSGVHIPAQDTLALHWDFETVTGSDSSGEFSVQDFSSGSSVGRYGWLENIINENHTGRGFGFDASSEAVVSNEFLFASKKELPEISFTSDTITIMGDDEIYLHEDEDVSDNIFSFEKSMYQSVSEKMLDMFSTMIEYSNLFAKPIDRYRTDYKRLDHTRKLFFERVSGDMDLDRFTDYFKWIDKSISFFLEKLHPVGSRFNAGLADMVESHILERPKYQHRFPSIERKTATEGSIMGGRELRYNWQFGHAPFYKSEQYNEKSITISSTGYLQHNQASAYAGTGSISFWFNPSSDNTSRTIISISPNRFVKYDPTLNVPNGAFVYVVKNTSGTDWEWTFNAPGKPVMVILTDDNTSTIGAVSASFNGAALAGPASITPSPATNPGTRSTIVGNVQIGFGAVNDTFDELSFWNKELTAADAASIYNAGKAVDLVNHDSASNLVSYYRFGDHPDDPPDEPFKGLTLNDSKGPYGLTVKGINSTYASNLAASFPVTTEDQNIHCRWFKERKERTGAREAIRKVLTTHRDAVGPNFGDNDQNIYTGGTYAIRNLSRPYTISAKSQNSIHGGTNYATPKDRDFLKPLLAPHGPTSSLGAPVNVIVMGVGLGQGLIDPEPCKDVVDPHKKEKYSSVAVIGQFSNYDGTAPVTGSNVGSTPEFAYNLKGEIVFPFNIINDVVDTGYNKSIHDSHEKDAVLTNLHSDTTSPTNEIPMQGPFTNQWVGGRQSRHIPLSNGQEDHTNRAEEWRILLGEHPSEPIVDGALGLTGPDYGGPYPDPTRTKAIYYRDERAKRPINVKNIQSSTASSNLGNYTNNYEVLMSTGRTENNRHLKSSGSTQVYLASEFSTLPHTTNQVGLLGLNPGTVGNTQLNSEGGNRIADSFKQLSDWQEIATPNKTIIVSRFSAPGGIETSPAYLDIYAKEKGAYNSLNYRNHTVIGSVGAGAAGGSGEAGTLRVNSHANRREGLNRLHARHCGKFGLDSQHGIVSSADYNAEASFHKTHRNTKVQPAIDKALRMPSTTESIQGVIGIAQSTYPASGFLSLSFWCKLDENRDEENAFIVEADNSSNANIFIVDFFQGLLRVRIFAGGGGSADRRYVTTVSSINLTEWNHYAIIINIDQAQTAPTGFINTSPVSFTQNFAGASPTGGIGQIDQRIILMGNDELSAVADLQGSLQHFAFYSGSLNQTQVDEIYNSRYLVGTSLQSDIIDYWQLGNEGEFDAFSDGDAVTNGLVFQATIGSTSLTINENIFISQGEQPTTDKRNNFYVQTAIPQSDYNYSWATSSLGDNYSVRSGTQKVFGFWPKNGILSSSSGFDSAILFPSASAIKIYGG